MTGTVYIYINLFIKVFRCPCSGGQACPGHPLWMLIGSVSLRTVQLEADGGAGLLNQSVKSAASMLLHHHTTEKDTKHTGTSPNVLLHEVDGSKLPQKIHSSPPFSKPAVTSVFQFSLLSAGQLSTWLSRWRPAKGTNSVDYGKVLTG